MRILNLIEMMNYYNNVDEVILFFTADHDLIYSYNILSGDEN